MKLDDVFARRDALNKQIVSEKKKIEKLQEEFFRGSYDENTPLKSVVEAFSTAPDNEYLTSLLKRWGEQYSLYKSGYDLELFQPAYDIKLDRNDQEQARLTIDGLQQLIAILKPTKRGHLFFHVFEHTLSLYGAYFVSVKDVNNCKVTKGRGYDADRVLYEGTLEQCIRYVSENHWYRDKNISFSSDEGKD